MIGPPGPMWRTMLLRTPASVSATSGDHQRKIDAAVAAIVAVDRAAHTNNANRKRTRAFT